MTALLRDRLTRYSFPPPAAVFVSAVALLPVLFTLWFSLRREMPIFQISHFAGLSNYAFLLSDARFWQAARHTAVFVLFAVGIEIVLGLAIALLLHRPFPGRGIARALVFLPWAVPSVVAARFWEWILNADFGVLNYLLGLRVNWLGDPSFALPAAIAADVWKTTPFVVLLLLVGLQTIPEDLYRAARIDGATPLQLFRHITLPLLKPVILLALIFRTLDAARVFDLIFVLTGGGPANQTETLVVYSYKLLYRTLQFGYGSTVAVAAFLFLFVLILAYLRELRRVWQLRGE